MDIPLAQNTTFAVANIEQVRCMEFHQNAVVTFRVRCDRFGAVSELCLMLGAMLTAVIASEYFLEQPNLALNS